MRRGRPSSSHFQRVLRRRRDRAFSSQRGCVQLRGPAAHSASAGGKPRTPEWSWCYGDGGTSRVPFPAYVLKRCQGLDEAQLAVALHEITIFGPVS